MKTAFISDLHLSDAHPEITRLFLQFLERHQSALTALYILGDFMDVWTGDDDPGLLGLTIIRALRKATNQGLPVWFMHGNRDFLAGKRFFAMSGCRPLPSEHVIDLYGKRVLLMHGDTLCTEDTAYQRFRMWSRNPLIKYIFLHMPVKKRREICHRFRRLSEKHTGQTAASIMDVTPRAVENIMRKHGVNTLIHGHTHRPGIHHFLLDGTPAKRIVLPAWHTSGGALLCEPADRQTLIEITA